MNTKIYVENLAADTTEHQLQDLFSAFGNVANVNIAFDADRKSRCFGWVTMMTPEGARAAIQALNGKIVGSATLAVREWWSSGAAILRTNEVPSEVPASSIKSLPSMSWLKVR